MERKQKETSSPSKIPTAHLLKSKALAGYQPDFAKALLPEPAYTAAEARNILDHYLKKGGKA